MELIYPKVHTSLSLGIKSRETNMLKNQYLFFIPQIADNKNNDKNKDIISAVLDKLKIDTKGILDRLVTKPSNESETLYIGLPLKPISLNLDHKYELADVFVGGAAGQALSSVQNMLKKMGTTVIENAIKSDFGELIGLDKIKNTFLAQTGLATYQPKRNLYQGTDTSGLTFSYILSPRNKEEADTIYCIVKAFQFYSMTQSRQALNDANMTDYFIKAPAIWKIKFYGSDSTNQSSVSNLPDNLFLAGNEFKAMVLKSVKVDYGGDNELVFIQKAKENCFPAQIKLDMEFDFYMDVGSSQDFLGIDDFKQDVYDKYGPSSTNK